MDHHVHEVGIFEGDRGPSERRFHRIASRATTRSSIASGTVRGGVVAVMPMTTFAQADAKVLYVLTSRATHEVHVCTDCKSAFKEAVLRPGKAHERLRQGNSGDPEDDEGAKDHPEDPHGFHCADGAADFSRPRRLWKRER
jgi:hypothetical protein